MAPPNLTRADAQARAALLQVADYTVALDLTDGAGKPGDTTFATDVIVRFAAKVPPASQARRAGSTSWAPRSAQPR